MCCFPGHARRRRAADRHRRSRLETCTRDGHRRAAICCTGIWRRLTFGAGILEPFRWFPLARKATICITQLPELFGAVAL